MQTSEAVALGCGKLEIDVGCNGVWVDISGSSTSLDPISQDRMTGETYTLDGMRPIIRGGKKQPFEAVVTIVYTEVAGEAWETIEDAWDAATCDPMVCLRWSPKGGAVGEKQYRIPNGILTQITFPNMDASAGGPIAAGFVVRAGYVEPTVISS